MKKFMALALASSILFTTNVSAYSVPERDFGAFDGLIRALNFWKDARQTVEVPQPLAKVPSKKIVKEEPTTRVNIAKLIVQPAEAKEIEPTVVEEIVVEEKIVAELEPKKSESAPTAKKTVEKKQVIAAKLQEEAISVETEVLDKVEPQTVTFENKTKRKRTVRRAEKREYVRHDRFMDFNIPEKLLTQIFDPKYSEASGTVTGDILQHVNHPVPDADLRAQGIKELVGVGISNFTGSDKARLHNIHNAVSKFDGRIIKQGEEFSFNNILQNAGPSNGFVLAKVIIQGMTKYGWGGGVCQLSTTVFRSVFNAGLPVTARRNHTFQVPYYKPQGFDATIYLGGQDLKFVNDTPGDIMIQIALQGDNMAVLLYGTRDRKTQVVGPVQNGMKYTWNRTITKGGESAEETLTSYYQREIVPVAIAE